MAPAAATLRVAAAGPPRVFRPPRGIRLCPGLPERPSVPPEARKSMDPLPETNACASGSAGSVHARRMHAPLPSAGHETTETMTLSRGSRGDAGWFRRMAARVATALLVAAMLAALSACPAAATSASRAQSRAAASASAKRVKYYIVPQPKNGQAVALYGIAARTLGDTHRYLEIFTLNKGRLQPDGRRLENPRIIDPGWIRQLPADASGPGVRFGRLPRVSRSATAPASHRPSAPAGSGAATHFTPGPAGTGSAVVVGGAIVLFATAGLAVVIRRRRAGAARRRKHSHTRRPQPQRGTGNDAAATAPDLRASGPRWPGPDHQVTDHPSFPGGSYPGAASTGPGRRNPDPRLTDHPSFPGGSYPRAPTRTSPTTPASPAPIRGIPARAVLARAVPVPTTPAGPEAPAGPPGHGGRRRRNRITVIPRGQRHRRRQGRGPPPVSGVRRTRRLVARLTGRNNSQRRWPGRRVRPPRPTRTSPSVTAGSRSF